MKADIILDKLNYHRSIIQPSNHLETFLKAAEYCKALNQFDKLNYYTSVQQLSLIDRLNEIK